MTNLFSTPSITAYLTHLRAQERAASTLSQYARALRRFQHFARHRPIDKALLLEWKTHLTQRYAPATVNTILAALNSYLKFNDRPDLLLKPLRIQRALFADEERELTRDEYIRLVRTAEKNGDHRLALILQTLAATGIRISELSFITVEAVKTGRAHVHNKGKHRLVLLPTRLRPLLKRYLRQQKKTTGPVFTTRTGRPLDRSNIWRAMKTLCQAACVDPRKVFPHNLRHLFARAFYAAEKDLLRLADLLGHASINTTRIYTLESGAEHQRQLDHMRMVITS